MTRKTPFPWPGGKSHVAEAVWRALGDVPNYIEPFCGSAAVLLARPTPPGAETINDLSCHVANFWRALKSDPKRLAREADWPVSEADLVARRARLHAEHAALRAEIVRDPDYCDVRAAGWWLWGQCASIADSWSVERVRVGQRGALQHLPHLSSHGQGVHAKSWRGVVEARLRELSVRLRYVRVACGDWSRVVTASATTGFNHVAGGTLTGIFLDPPYHDREYIYDATRTEHKRRTGRQSREATATRPTASREVGRWALRAGRDPRLRLVVCGRRGEFLLDGWRTQVVRQDVLWLSPGCL